MKAPIKKLALKPATPSAHVCTPHHETVAMLKGGGRSGVRELCQSCLQVRTWILFRDGSVIAMKGAT